MSIEGVPNLSFGLSEQRLRERMEEQLVRYMHAEGEAPTINAIASAFARVSRRIISRWPSNWSVPAYGCHRHEVLAIRS